MTAAKGKRLAAAKKTMTRKVHLHIENYDDLGPVFEVTPKRIKEALARHPKMARQVHITTGREGRTLAKNLKTADVLFTWYINDRDRFAEMAPHVRWVAVHGAGVSHLMPLNWLPEGAVMTNSAGVHGDRANEYAMMAILMLNNRVPEMTTNQRRSRWDQLFNSGIKDKTLLIVGVGAVGAGAARHAKHFGLNVIGVRRSGKPRPYVDEMHTPDKLRRLLPKADFLLICAPDTVHTHHMIGKIELDLMKKGAGICVFSRSGTVDYKALRTKLQRGDLRAVLDVFDPEPLPKSSPLWKTPNLVITPHCSSDDWDLYTPRTLDLLFENMSRFLRGRKLKNIVDPVLQY